MEIRSLRHNVSHVKHFLDSFPSQFLIFVSSSRQSRHHSWKRPHFKEVFPSACTNPLGVYYCVTLNSIMRHNGMNNYDLCIKIHLLCVHSESVYVCEAQTWFIHWISKQFSMMIVFQWSLRDYLLALILAESGADCFESKAQSEHTRVHY